MKKILTILFATFIIASGIYYQFLYEPTIQNAVVIKADESPYKKRPKFDNTLSSQYLNSFDPLDHQAKLNTRATLRPDPEQPIDIFSKASSSEEDQLNQIINDMESGEKELSELVILPKDINAKKDLKEYKVTTKVSEKKTSKNPLLLKRKQEKTTIQIASVRSSTQSEKECDRIRNKYPELLNNYHCSTTPAKTNKGTFYKVLLTGFTSKTEAKLLCKKLRSKKQNCILSTR